MTGAFPTALNKICTEGQYDVNEDIVSRLEQANAPCAVFLALYVWRASRALESTLRSIEVAVLLVSLGVSVEAVHKPS